MMNNDIYEEFNAIKEQIRQEVDNLKAEIMDFIRLEAPLKADLEEIKKENKSLKGKLEFIKLVLKEINLNSYNKVVNKVFTK